MNIPVFRMMGLIGLFTPGLSAQTAPVFTNFIRQVQNATNVQWDAAITKSGSQIAALPVQEGGSRFELWTVQANPLKSYLLDTKPVGIYPVASVKITSDDPYGPIPRTQEGRPFYVEIDVRCLNTNADSSPVEKGVKLLRHLQAYPAGGTGENLDRSQATLQETKFISKEGTVNYTFSSSLVPGEPGYVRGEERFSIYSLTDPKAPESQLASQYIKVWPSSKGSISGIGSNPNVRDVVKGAMPPVTMRVEDVYPGATIYAQIYRGGEVLGTQGMRLTTHWVNTENYPQTKVLYPTDWNQLTEDDDWTIELLMESPFGPERLKHVTFTLKRNIKVNSSLNTME